MSQEVIKKKMEGKSGFEIGSEVGILINGAMSSGWKIKKIFDAGPLAGRVMLEKEEKDIWAGKEIGIKSRKRIVDMESLEKWNRTFN